MSNSPILLAAACAACVCLPASPAAAAGGSAKRVSFRVLCTEAREGMTSVQPPTGNRSIEVPLFDGSFTELLEAKFPDGKAAFYVEERQDRKRALKLVAEGPLAKGERQVFLLVPSAAESGPAFRIIAFDDGDRDFAMGATRVLNLTPFALRLNVAGTEQEPIKAGETGVFPLCTEVDEWDMYSARLDLELEKGKWQNVATQSWKSSDRKRDWVVVSYNPATKEPKIRIYQDTPPWTTPELAPEGRRSSRRRD